MFNLIVFDLDGTLIDSRRDIADAANALLIETGAAPLPEDRIGRMVGDGASVLVRRVFEAAERPLPPAALDDFVRLYNARLVAHTRPYDGVEEVLSALSARSSLAVLTNKPLEATRRILEALDLSRFFRDDRVLGGDGPIARKPDPAGLKHLMRTSGADAPGTAMVGDSLIDWKTAAAAGTQICLARYGFGFEGFPVERLGSSERLIDSPRELLRWL